MKSLRDAREQRKLDQFIKEREGDATGDADQVNRTLKAMAQRSKAVPKALGRGNRDG